MVVRVRFPARAQWVGSAINRLKRQAVNLKDGGSSPSRPAMIKRNLYFLDGTLFANGYERVVHGGRGDYVELTNGQIELELKSHFKQELPKELSDEEFFYYWLEPIGREEKVYWQCHQVHYADYKRNYYYIDPKLLISFDNKELF